MDKKGMIGKILFVIAAIVIVLVLFSYIDVDITSPTDECRATCKDKWHYSFLSYDTSGNNIVGGQCWCKDNEGKPIQVPLN